MPRVCTICSHDKRLRIDRAVLAGKNIAEIARLYNVSYQALWSHSRHHISRQLLKATSMRQQLDLEAVSNEFQSLYERAKDLFNRIEEQGPSHVSAALLRELRSTLETIAKWGISCETLSQTQAQTQAQQDAEQQKLSMRLSIERLSPEELQMFQYLLAKMQGQKDLPALPGSSFRLPPPPTVIDLAPVEKVSNSHNLVVSPPALEEEPLPPTEEEEPPKRIRTRSTPIPQQPKKHAVWNARRQIAEKLGINTKYERW